MSQAVLEELRRVFPHYIKDTHAYRGDETAIIKREGLLPIVEFLKHSLGFDMLIDICGNDYPEREERFEVIYHFLATGHTPIERNKWKRIRLRIPLTEDDAVVPSLVDLYKKANWFERETWDMFGIEFEGHPNLRRILTHWKFEGHPLRKDYEKEHRQYLDETAPMEWFGIKPHTKEDGTETVTVNIGPAHPVTHGIVRLMAEMDGENIIDGELEIGYLHRCFEKEVEAHKWGTVLPYCDRLNYVSAPNNTIGYSIAVEKFAGIEVPDRAKWLRMIFAELGRIMDHCTCLGPALLDMGALTNYWYFFKIREYAYSILERYTGSRLTSTVDRIGGYKRDVYDGFGDDVRGLRKVLDKNLGDVEKLITNNRIFLDRTVGVGKMSREMAIEFGITGPVARAAGVEYDVRKSHPYLFYDQVDFEMVLGEAGDTFDRLMVRLYEMKESMKIIEQALEHFEGMTGPLMADVPNITYPPEGKNYSQMEDLIRHFNIIYRGERIPKGEVYSYTESPNGELGFYMVSDGTGSPQRIHVHPPSFSVLQSYIPVIRGLMLADAVVVFSSYNIIAGELDR